MSDALKLAIQDFEDAQTYLNEKAPYLYCGDIVDKALKFAEVAARNRQAYELGEEARRRRNRARMGPL